MKMMQMLAAAGLAVAAVAASAPAEAQRWHGYHHGLRYGHGDYGYHRGYGHRYYRPAPRGFYRHGWHHRDRYYR